VKLQLAGFNESGELALTGFSNTGELQLTGKWTTSCKSFSSDFWM
jgi:hypothetical protein